MAKWKNKLIVSCQDNPTWTIAKAVEAGCGGLRVDTQANVQLARSLAPGIPIVACWKHDMPGTDVRITPRIDHAILLAQGGADYVAFDATQRERPYTVQAMINAIRQTGGLAVADVATEREGMDAWQAGADVVATTLAPDLTDAFRIVRSLASAGVYVMAEGNIRTPWQAAKMIDEGAECVCVGSAITRPHVVTGWFLEVLR